VKHYVAYHKVKEWGEYPTGQTEFAHYSGKLLTTLQKLIGQTVWVISGKKQDKAMTYTLVSTYIVSYLEDIDTGGHLVVGDGVSYEPGIKLNDYAWFEVLFSEQRRFSFGLNEIRDEAVIEGLKQLVTSTSTSVLPSGKEELLEGECKQVTRNVYERNREARRKCLEYYGYTCTVCHFDFEKQYGDIGRAFIHVHHLVPLAMRGKEYQINPVEDLRPVCPNCHAILHKKEPPYLVEELRLRIQHPFKS
jgi:5-methylcytosine-specific restriction protein A